MSHRPQSPVRKSRRPLAAAAAAFALFLVPAFARAADAGPCSGNARQLDFWLGDWSVSAPGSAPNAVSHVSSALDGCLIVESWDGGRGHIGENFMAWSADDQRWHGFFADNKGRVHLFADGTASADSATFTAPSRDANGATVLNRVTIHRVSADQVEQLWLKSADNGATWTTEFRGLYTRKPSN